MKALIELGANMLLLLRKVGKAGLFLACTLQCLLKPRGDYQAIIPQCFRVGVLSFSVIAVCALFIGMVVALQGFNTLEKFGAEMQLGQLLALSVLRELGPVVTGLLYAGRAGSALTAEIGLMQVTHQIPAMEVMAVNPLAKVVFPRFIAGFLMMPCLVILFNVIALFGGYLVGVHWLDLDGGLFWSNMQSSVHFHGDVLNGLYKGVVFAFFINWVAVYQGFHAYPSAAGIGSASTRTVVMASVLVLALDFILTSLMLGGW